MPVFLHYIVHKPNGVALKSTNQYISWALIIKTLDTFKHPR